MHIGARTDDIAPEHTQSRTAAGAMHDAAKGSGRTWNLVSARHSLSLMNCLGGLEGDEHVGHRVKKLVHVLIDGRYKAGGLI